MEPLIEDNLPKKVDKAGTLTELKEKKAKVKQRVCDDMAIKNRHYKTYSAEVVLQVDDQENVQKMYSMPSIDVADNESLDLQGSLQPSIDETSDYQN